MKTVLHVVGARPNFMKVAPIYRVIQERGRLAQRLVHTGQHYDVKMSDVFFTDLGLPSPDMHLGVGSGAHGEQTAKIMMALEQAFTKERPDLISVVGDVNSTLAATLVAAKMLIPLAHVEAGLRSFDRTMPEEVNRLVTDRLADLLLTPSRDADEHLKREGIEPSKIHFVGNVMIDSLLFSKEKADRLPILESLELKRSGYAICTLHRASNVDDASLLTGLLEAIGFVAQSMPVIFPVHPRTRKMLESPQSAQLLARFPNLRLTDPFGYLDFLALMSQARLVLTDSGGLQEETTALGIPCLTLRENTERPITVEEGTNVVVGTQPKRIIEEAKKILDGHGKKGRIPEYWDGKSSDRIAAIYERTLGVTA